MDRRADGGDGTTTNDKRNVERWKEEREREREREEGKHVAEQTYFNKTYRTVLFLDSLQSLFMTNITSNSNTGTIAHTGATVGIII